MARKSYPVKALAMLLFAGTATLSATAVGGENNDWGHTVLESVVWNPAGVKSAGIEFQRVSLDKVRIKPAGDHVGGKTEQISINTLVRRFGTPFAINPAGANGPTVALPYYFGDGTGVASYRWLVATPRDGR